MNLHNNLIFVLVVLIVVLIIKQFLESGYFLSLKNILSTDNTQVLDNTLVFEQDSEKNVIEQMKFQQLLNKTIMETQEKINKASEMGYLESFKSNNIDNIDNIDNQTDQNKQNNGYLTSYLNKNNTVKIQLFYKKTCKYCANFMPTWNQIINNLPNDATYEEIDCNKDIKKATENNITSVPTIILLVDNEKKIYMGNRNYNDIDRFCKTNGVNLVQRQFENFNNGYSNSPNPTEPLNPHCPAVSFDKQIDLNADNYMYQIFNSDGQYGYEVGGYNSDKLLNPFNAAYSTVDTYLSSLPDNNDPTQNSYANINECAQLYADNIINFGLCDSEQLNNILGYQSNVASGSHISRADNTNYNTNATVINAIKNVCGL